jgi:hypothetical protein
MDNLISHWIAYAFTMTYLLVSVTSLYVAEKRGVLDNELYLLNVLFPPAALLMALLIDREANKTGKGIHIANYLFYIVVILTLVGMTRLRPELLIALLEKLWIFG